MTINLAGRKASYLGCMIAEATKLGPYLDFILDKEIVTLAARKNVHMVRQVLKKNTMDTANNAISFLNNLREEEIRNENIQDIGLVITWARKVVNKYHHLETFQATIDVMHN